jgi:hypothetical protein
MLQPTSHFSTSFKLCIGHWEAAAVERIPFFARHLSHMLLVLYSVREGKTGASALAVVMPVIARPVEPN